MYFPFLITLQQEKTERRKEVLLKRKLNTTCQPVAGVKVAIQKANDACTLFKEEIKNPYNKFKSYIPFTNMFTQRLICAERLSNLNNLLDQVEKNLSKGKPKKPNSSPLKARIVTESKLNHSSPIKKSLSNYTDTLHRSPIGTSIRKNKSEPFGVLNKPANLLPILLRI